MIAALEYFETQFSRKLQCRRIRCVCVAARGAANEADNAVYNAWGQAAGYTASQTGSGTVTLNQRHIYYGTNLLAVLNVDPTTGVPTVAQRFLSGPNENQIIAQDNASSTGQAGAVSWAITDNTGSVVDVVANGSGNTILDHIVYDSFGNTVSQTNASNAMLMGYQGYILDSITGLYYANARYYSPQLGRFISQDPSGFSAGDSNLYRFVGNHPTYSVDPTGLYEGGSSFTPDFSANSVSFNTSVGSSPTSLTGSMSSVGSGGYTPIGGGSMNYTMPQGMNVGQSLGVAYGGNSQPSAANMLGGGGYASLGMSSPNNGMATPSQLGAAWQQNVQETAAYSDAATAALSNPISLYDMNGNSTTIPTVTTDYTAPTPDQVYQEFGNALAQSGALPNPSIWEPQAQEMFGPNPVTNRLFGALQAGGGLAEAVIGGAMGGIGTASEFGSAGVTTPVSVPAMVGGSILAANGADNAWAGLQTAWSGQPSETYTQQAITTATGNPSVGVWGNVLIGMVGGNDAAAAENSTAESLVNWVDEGGNLRAGGNPGMSSNAYNFQSGTLGARSSLITGRSQTPYLSFTDESGNIIGAKFDGVNGTELIDAKLNPFFSAKAIDEATRQAAVARYYGLQAVWEFPTQDAVNAANRFMQTNNVTGITVRLRP